MGLSSERYTTVLDTKGLTCPEPVILLHNAIRDISSGETVKVLATDPATTRDIPKFCQFLGHTLLKAVEQEKEAPYIFLVQKK